MTAVLDMERYPWHLAEARELHMVLCRLYPTSKGAMFIARQAEIDEARIFAEQEAYFVWQQILDRGAETHKNRNVVARVREQHPASSYRAFLDAMLASETPVLDAEPRGQAGAPVFLAGTDEIFEEEAYLFHDDLTLPVGKIPWLIGVLEMLKALAPAVCRLTVARAGRSKRGTGFRIAPDLLLSNHHVLTFAGESPTQVIAEFGYDDDGRGAGAESTAVSCDVTSVRSEPVDDWAVIRVSEPLPDTIPAIQLSAHAAPLLNEPAFIVQHPGGDRKRLGFVRNQITEIKARVVHYLTDTQFGSSGAPVFNDSGALIALHHAGGRPQEVAGKPPLLKNEGVLIASVLEGLGRAGVAVP